MENRRLPTTRDVMSRKGERDLSRSLRTPRLEMGVRGLFGFVDLKLGSCQADDNLEGEGGMFSLSL